ncbi:hypothetical protein K469DRAFT_285261 [Zopfia rhizophila CBS 207.26]|uniref:Protein kinase domain-containing protein n=1 Tax=Zopfia rhizophila CBS 207.26 TaxID=1314779 RepID=A0A6A6EPD5_9PEZI|nr:hypothetical protein K469DRAFT_285261 [Zopfia rhizophila CBS 207.26]
MAEQVSESKRLSQEMRQHVENSRDFNIRFMPNGKVEYVLDKTNLTALFQEHLARRGSNASAAEYAAKTIGEGNRCVPRRKLLAIIIFGNVDQNLEKFVDWLERDFSGVPSDERLPLKDHKEVEHWFGDGAERFLEIQPIFNPHVYKDKTPLYVEKSEERFYRHPLIGDPVELGKGAFSRVEKITVAAGHFVEDGTPSTQAISLARKVFKDQELAQEANPDFANEESILAQLEAQPWVHRNLMRNRGSIVVREGAVVCHCTLLYDLATSNLGDVFMNTDASKLLARASLDDKYQLIHYFTDLVDGVDHFHDASLIHMDIKWDNILVIIVLGKTYWKLADYNLCKLKTRKMHQNATSSTNSKRPPGVFQAPEVRGTGDGNVGWWSDYWSLGCLLIYLLAYLDGGADAIKKLEEYLRQYDPTYARFYSMATKKFSTKENPKVNKGFKKFCKSLRDNAQARDLQAGRRGEGEGSLVDTMLKFVEEHIFIVDRKKRKVPEYKTHHFAQMMKQTRKRYECLKNGDFDSPSETQQASWGVANPSGLVHKKCSFSGASFSQRVFWSSAGRSSSTSVRPEPNQDNQVVSELNDQTGRGTPASRNVHASRHDELPRPSDQPDTRTPPEPPNSLLSYTASLQSPPQSQECSFLCKAVNNSPTRSSENLSPLDDAHVSMDSPTVACPGCRNPPLHTLISRFYGPHCKALLDTLLEPMRGADLNSNDRHGRTPLQAALKKGNLGVCELLLERHTRWGVQIDWTYIENHWHEYNPDVKAFVNAARKGKMR